MLRAPGQLVVNPTNLGLAFPHGGTRVGSVRLVALTVAGQGFRVESEALGEATDVLEGPNRYVFACFLRGWDDDAVRLFLADNYRQGAVSGHAVFSEPGDSVPGSSALGRAARILYVPDDPVHAPALLIHRGVPDWSDNAEVAWRRRDELGIPLAVECIRSAAGKIVEIGMIADLTLT